MKLLVFSDTHRMVGLAAALVGVIADVDHIIHLGDLTQDAARLSRITGRPIISVRGNCDLDVAGDDVRVIETECGSILLIHGHMEHVKSTLEYLRDKTLEEGCKTVFYGHTHIARVDEIDGVMFVNPGSLTFPGEGKEPSYAVVNIDQDGISAIIVYVSKEMRQALGIMY
ncbi:MAG: metallophosphatase family protein [Clostridiales Family XIII bacterium]|jgi:putative phosphoesterase|nr:metallophosphatase family protein [Clostridiales Family XIII bacterium]